MNNKCMYSRCIIPEISNTHEWKTVEDAEIKKLRKIKSSLQKTVRRQIKKNRKLNTSKNQIRRKEQDERKSVKN